MATHYETSLVAFDHCGEIGTFVLTRPDGYDYVAGQWLRLTLDTAEGREARTLSIASAPSDPELVLVTRDSPSAYKRALFASTVGDAFEVSAPGGRLRLPENADPVFLVGGVGITPIRSLLRDARSRGVSLEGGALFYGNREPACVPFLAEFDALSREGLRVVHVFEREGRPGDESGFIGAQLVRRTVRDAEDRVYMVTGPPAMVEAMERVLDELGVAPQNRVIERFTASVRR